MLSQETGNKSSFYFIIQHVHWLDSKRKPEKLGLDKCENHLFWNSPACLIHDNTSTLPLLVFDYRWNTCTGINWWFASMNICWWTRFPLSFQTSIKLKHFGRLKLET